MMYKDDEAIPHKHRSWTSVASTSKRTPEKGTKGYKTPKTVCEAKKQNQNHLCP